MEIDLGQEVIIKVKLSGSVYELREPTMNDLDIMAVEDKEDTRKVNKALQDFIVELGMPRDIVESMGILKLKALTEGLTSSFSEKK